MLIKKLILKKKWIKVTIRDINIKPRNILRKKSFLISELIILPYPDIDSDRKVIPKIKISIWKKII